jgi:hypothetical protein
MMRSLIVAAAVFVSAPAMAEVVVVYPVSIPQECFELARREGVPTVIANKFEAMHARNKLNRLKSSDPLVRECRDAVQRAKAAAEQAGRYVNKQ